MTVDEQPPDKDLIRRQKAQRVINAYHRVFGSRHEDRNDEQRLVMEHLDNSFGFNRPAFLQGRQGQYDPIQAAIRDGQRQVFLHIEAILSEPVKGDGDMKPKPKVIR